MPAAKHDPHKIGGVAGANLLHDTGAMNFYRAWANAEPPTHFLVGSASGDLCEYLAFARRKERSTGKISRPVGPVGFPVAFGICGNRTTHPRDDGARIKRLHQIVERAIFYCLDSRTDVAVARHDENWCRIAMRIEFFENGHA